MRDAIIDYDTITKSSRHDRTARGLHSLHRIPEPALSRVRFLEANKVGNRVALIYNGRWASSFPSLRPQHPRTTSRLEYQLHNIHKRSRRSHHTILTSLPDTCAYHTTYNLNHQYPKEHFSPKVTTHPSIPKMRLANPAMFHPNFSHFTN